MLSRIIPHIGFAWAVRAMALVVFALQAISIPFIKERMPPSKETRPIDLSAFKDMRFVMHALSGFFTSFGECPERLGIPSPPATAVVMTREHVRVIY